MPTKKDPRLERAGVSGYNKPKQRKHRFAFSGLLSCGKCGSAITAEIQKGKYIYYHCTGFKGKCGNSYIREEVLTDKFKKYSN